MTAKSFNKLLKETKQRDLSYDQLKVIGQLIGEGASVERAIKELDNFVVRRVNIGLNKETEKKIMKSHNFAYPKDLFRAILSGEISGTKNLVYEKIK